MAQLRVTSKALPEHNRQHNRSLLLQTLLHDGPMSRADLARESGLTRVTVSDLVNDLASEGLINELGTRTGAHVGKPAKLIGLNENAYHVVSLDLSPDDRFVGAIIAIDGKIVHRAEVPLENATGEAALRKALDLAGDLVKRTTARLLGIGVGTPGIVDSEGVVLAAPNLDWRGLDLAAAFRTEFSVPVHVGNDANGAALAVRTFQESGSSFMLVAIEHGVGAGLIIGDMLIEGIHSTAGEIGHLVVDENGERCACGRRGCLEQAIAVPHLRDRIRDAGADKRDAVLADAGHSLGLALAPIIAALGLDDLVLAGPQDLLEGPFVDAALDTVRARILTTVGDGPTVRIARDSDDLVLLGTAVFVLSAELGVS
ncbi:ROK family transcriptional regulator [Humibacter ginsenosidimutans]|uniref:ROK family transcriptional regulator n=1 Tax=Humibacter ginsenosidimutans TaxID=2599293 RepID=A0A5B8M2F0_9MICO|nr:ROK family transcriptional regulator [Humibacter ginsenosidimutans]QDZ14827.1 ROK family transcriptional regulator [Humibacter ginsenosidimutans]